MKAFHTRAGNASLRRILAVALLASAGAALAQQAPAPQPSAAAQPVAQPGVPAWSIASADLPADPAVRFGVLPNGMRYALMHHEMPKGAAAIRFSINVGVRDETDPQMGAAHFVEHMAFNGSTNIPEGELGPGSSGSASRSVPTPMPRPASMSPPTSSTFRAPMTKPSMPA